MNSGGKIYINFAKSNIINENDAMIMACRSGYQGTFKI